MGEKYLFRQLTEEEKDDVVRTFSGMEGTNLVPFEKDCRDCGACCFALRSQFKDHGVVCPKLEKAHGKFACTKYSSRPKQCKDFHCNELTIGYRGRKKMIAIELKAAHVILKRTSL